MKTLRKIALLISHFLWFSSALNAQEKVTVTLTGRYTGSSQVKQLDTNFTADFKNIKLKKGESKGSYMNLLGQFKIANSRFIDTADFSYIRFYGQSLYFFSGNTNTYIGMSNFENFADFGSCHFSNVSTFILDTFHQGVNFSFSTFDKTLIGSYFKKNADFDQCTFQGQSTISSKFDGNAYFRQAGFTGKIYFTQSVFSKFLDLSFLNLSDTTEFNFYQVTFPDLINFSYNPKIKSEIDLSVGDFTNSTRYDSTIGGYREGRMHAIYLFKSEIPKFHFDYIHFRLTFLDPVSGDKLPDDEIKSIYETVLKNFKDRGQMDSYELLDIEYHDYKWKQSKYFSWFGTWLHYWNYYGYKKELPLLWTLYLFLIFTIAIFFIIKFLNTRVYTIDSIPELPSLALSFSSRKSLSKRLWYSFIYSGSVFFLFSLKVEKIQFKNKLGTLFLILVFTIGLICVAYMANFVLQK